MKIRCLEREYTEIIVNSYDVFLEYFWSDISYLIMKFLFFRDEEIWAEEAALMKRINKCVKSFGKCTVEQTATLMAWSDKNNLPVDKYRERVQKQLDEDSE